MPKRTARKAKKSVSSSNSKQLTHRGRPAGTLWIGQTNPPFMRPVGTDETFTVIQSIGNAYIAQTAASVNVGVYTYTFSLLDQYASWAAVFDQYRIDVIETTFRPTNLGSSLSLPASIITPCLYTIIDFDDNTTPTGLAYMRQYESLSVSQNETVVRTFEPHVALAAYSGAFTSYANAARQWIDASSSGVAHYGCKWAIDAGAAGQTLLQAWNVSIRMKVSFRNVH
jgi:hypothetical protein